MRFIFILLLFTASCAPDLGVTKVKDVSDIEYLNNDHSDFSWQGNDLFVYDSRICRFIGKGQSLTHVPTADVAIHKVAGAIVVQNDSLINTKPGYKVYVTSDGSTSLHFVRNVIN